MGVRVQRERATGLEPATSSLGSWHSTTELRPRLHEGKAEKAEVKEPYFVAEASRKLLRSGSLTAGSPGATLSKRPSRIQRSSSPTSPNK
jgi:hypothetical protein